MEHKTYQSTDMLKDALSLTYQPKLRQSEVPLL